jgi:hypothetical protein
MKTKMKVKYEYDVVFQDGIVYYTGTRQEAREKKQLCEEFGNKAKIVQRKYVLQEEREVR